MKKLFLFLLVLSSFNQFAQSRYFTLQFFSEELGKQRNVNVYLPEDYNENDDKRYPVIYYLHGAGGTNTSDSFIKDTLDAMISSGRIQPVILVKPDGSTSKYMGSFYTNSSLYGKYEDYIINDVVYFIDSAYKTIDSPTKRGLIGHSMGAYGVAKLGLKHQDKFTVFAAHSGPLDFSKLPDLTGRIIYESGNPPYHYSPANGIFSMLGYTMAGAFSPNLLMLPEPVDFMIDSLGVMIDSVYEKWKNHNPAKLVKEFEKLPRTSIYFDCGTMDELGMYNFNLAFKDTLVKMNIPHKFLSYSGFHSMQLKSRIPISLKFVDSVFNSSVTYTQNEDQNKISNFIVEQNYPNPFNGETVIKYSVPVKTNVQIKVYNVIGKEISTLLNEVKEEGEYSVKVSSNNLPSGVYFYKVDGGSHTFVKKMIVLK